MTILVQRIVAGLQQPENTTEFQECCLLASELLPAALKPIEYASVTASSGDVLSTTDAARIVELLIQQLKDNREPEIMISVLFALGKIDSKEYKDIYIQVLSHCVERTKYYSSALFQALVTLRNIGEDVFERDEFGQSSQNILDIDKNMRQAVSYLDKHT
jgi:hypothetical protein